jgi:cysteine desulfuration protein SufE
MAEIEHIFEEFSFLDDWEDRYRYVIELGQSLEPYPEPLRTEANKVRGCVSQVWLASRVRRPAGGGEEVIEFAGDSDAHIVRGLIAILLAVYSGRSPPQILNIDGREILSRLGLAEHLTPQRSNGLVAMVERIRADAAARLGAPQQA